MGARINDNGIDRDMTDKEKAEYDAFVVVANQQKNAFDEALAAQQAAKESARAKLAALGLTDDEINALVGA